MGETKITKMIIKGDLQCYKCRKKIKKTLCKIPQIRDQVYDEKNNKVIITVVCCNPEKIRDKICSKACGSIESIEIVEEPKQPPPKPPEKKPEPPKEPPPKPKEPEKPKEPPPKPKEPEKPKEPPPKPKEPEKPKEPPPIPKEPEKPKEPPPKPKEPEKPKEPPPKPKEPEKPCQLVPMPYPGYPPPVCYPVVCCPCCGGYGGPCCHGRPPMCSDGCGRPVYECYGGSRGYYVSRCDYFNEENATGCTIM